MADNVLKATVDAIGQADNELGGTLATRLIEAHVHGCDNALLCFGNRIDTTPVDYFDAGMVGIEIDVLAKTPSTGNEGRYLISAVLGSTAVEVTTLAGAPVTWMVMESEARWRLGTLRVESTYAFLSPPTDTDTLGKLWVGDEPDLVTYAARTLTPTACSFDQLGDPITGLGYLTKLQREDAEVIEARRGYSDLDKLWRAMLTAYATEEELDRIGRVVNVPRPRGITDTIYRRLLQVMPYLPRCGIYAFELVLTALYPSKTPTQIREMIWEDLVSHPCAIFLLLPELEPGTVFEGRTLFNEVESVTSGSTTALTLAHTPITVESVVLAELLQELGMAVLPSADSPAWTYVNEGDIEGNVFSVQPLGLRQTISGTANGGRYKRVSPNISPELSRIQTWWSPAVLTTVANFPWHLMLHDGEIEACLAWDGINLVLSQLDGTILRGPVGVLHNTIGAWYHFELRRTGNLVEALLNDQVYLTEPASSFAANSTRESGFGYKNNSSSNTWTVYWNNLTLFARDSRNYLNLHRHDGVLSSSTAVLTSALGLFLAGDTGKLVRLAGALNQNNGLWRATYTAATQLTLGTVVRDEATVDGAGTAATVTLLDPWFRSVDVGKTITISGSTLGNNGDVIVLEVLDAWTARVNKTGAFAPEEHVSWGFKPVFATESSVPWELVSAATVVGTGITLRDALPGAATAVVVNYSSVLSAQILRDEFIRNDGSGGVAPNIFYPAYLCDVSDSIRRLLSDITAAGVIPYYQRID